MIQNTRIRLFGNVNGYLDTDETTVVPLTFSIAEIKDLSKRKGTFSKSIKIPGTKNNNILLNNYFDVNVQAGTFDINKKVTCAIIQNGITILDNAVMQLVSVEKSQNTLRENDSHTYTVLIKDTTSDLFSVISNKKLEDLQLNFLSHLYNANNVIDSFDNTVADGFKYVMPYNTNPDINGSDIYFNLNEFTPAIYAKKYFDGIFAEAGYSYNWPSMNDIDINFDKLLIPYNGDAKKDISIIDSLYQVIGERTTAYTQSTIYSTVNIDETYWAIRNSNYIRPIPIQEISDPNNLYNNNIYTTPNLPSNTNNTRIKLKVEYDIKVRNTSNQSRTLLNNFNSTNGQGMVLRPNLNLDRLVVTNVGSIWSQEFRIYNLSQLSGNGNLTLPLGYTISANTTTTIQSATAEFTDIINGIGSNSQYSFASWLKVPDFALNNYFVWVNSSNISQKNRDVFIDLVIKKITFEINTEVNGELGYNVPLNPKMFVPKNIKQSDYLKSIFTMFNLYAEVDKDKPTQLNIFKRNEYYDSGAEKNWTDKLVKDKSQEIKFLPEISKKKLILTYKEDKDWANEQYKNNVGEVYGQATFTFDNEYVQDTEKIEVIFSPTPVKNSPSLNAVLPMLEGQAPKTNIRILYDGGQKTCNTYSIFNYATTEYTAPAMITSNKYPLITHWDKASNPTFDLNFLPPDYYYRTDNFGSNTANGLFNLHWRRTMNQINTGRLMTAYFYLNEVDIFKLRLNDKIRIDNAWWNINKISDYNANSFEPTKVELISIDDELAIDFFQVNSAGIQQTSPILTGLNDWTTQGTRNKNAIYSEGLVEIAGINNTVGYQSSFVYGSGNNNFINGNSLVLGSNNVANGNTFMLGNFNSSINNNSLIIGDNNTINEESATNIIVVGNNITATTQSNTIYSNNLVISSGGTINGLNIDSFLSGNTNTYLTGGTYNNTNGTLTLTQNNLGPTITVTGFTTGGTGSLTGYVTTNTTQSITGYKEFTNIGYLNKVNTAVNPTQSGGNFVLGNTNAGSGYDRFNFYSLDGTDADTFGIASIYSNAEEGNYISHSSLDFTNDARLSVNQYNYNLQHIVSGQRTGLYIDGTVDKIKIEGTENKFAALGTSLITGTKNFEFPNQSGTLALLSDITGSTGTDITVTGGTYNNTTGIATFTNNTGGTFNVTGFNTGYTLTSGGITSALGYTPVSADTFTTGGTYSSGTLTLNNNNGSSFNITGLPTSGVTEWSGGTNYVIIRATGTPTQNGTALFNAYSVATGSTTSRFTIILMPGYYSYSTQFTMNKQYVDITSVNGERNVFFQVPIALNVNDVRLTGIDAGTNAISIGVVSNPLMIVKNCKGGAQSFNAVLNANNGTFIDCETTGIQTFGYNSASISGTYLNCKATSEAFGSTGLNFNTGYYKYCEAGDNSFGISLSTGPLNGSFIDCKGGNNSFGYAVNNIAALFFNCIALTTSFGTNSVTNSGQYINCKAGTDSFGSNLGATSLSARTNTGYYFNCKGDTQSFGYNQNFNGIANNCIASTNSFGGGTVGQLTGKVYYSKLNAGTFQTVSSGGKTVYCIDGSDTPNNQ